MFGNKILLMLAVSLLMVGVVVQVAFPLTVWQEGGSWFNAPEGYRIAEGGSLFCEDYAYNDYDEVIGFRWKISTVDNYGNHVYKYIDALMPDNCRYEWSPYPIEWVEKDDKIAYLATKYTSDANYKVWVYAPLAKIYANPTPTPTATPTPVPTSNPTAYPTASPTPMPSYSPAPSSTPVATMTPAPTISPIKIGGVKLSGVSIAMFVAAVFAFAGWIWTGIKKKNVKL